jgi:hypothetical protein
MAAAPENLTERHRAGIRLLVMGITRQDAAELLHIVPGDLTRAYRSAPGQEYAQHMRELCEHYAAAMHVLGLVPRDITRQAQPGAPPRPPASPAALRRTAAARIRARLGQGEQGKQAPPVEGTDIGDGSSSSGDSDHGDGDEGDRRHGNEGEAGRG